MGCPIRKSPDRSLIGSSPRLIAAFYVLHRHFLPRHSLCALCSLTKNSKKLFDEHYTQRVAIFRGKLSRIQLSKNLVRDPKNYFGGGDRHRTRNLWLAKPSLYQLSYTPSWILVIYHHKRTPKMVGLSGVEPLTSRLSGVRSNQLSYRPMDMSSPFLKAE